MIINNTKLGLSAIATALLFLLAGMSSALADQVTLSYVDANYEPQTIVLNDSTSTEDLALASSLMLKDGTGLVYDADSGSSSLADIAAAMAASAPVYAANVAEALAALSPSNLEAIVAAVNAVPGVNNVAVEAAVHFGPPGVEGPQLQIILGQGIVSPN
jgi:hypothetical protein